MYFLWELICSLEESICDIDILLSEITWSIGITEVSSDEDLLADLMVEAEE